MLQILGWKSFSSNKSAEGNSLRAWSEIVLDFWGQQLPIADDGVNTRAKITKTNVIRKFTVRLKKKTFEMVALFRGKQPL